ncbi:MAG: DNA gyrase inhibitor YacG [Pseudomonadota bacterium]
MSCPICQRPSEHRYRPFCSRRCADRDLGRWLSGGYAIAGPPLDQEDLTDEARSEAAAMPHAPIN